MKTINASVLNRLNNVVPKELQNYIKKTKIDETVPVEKNQFPVASSLSNGKKM